MVAARLGVRRAGEHELRVEAVDQALAHEQPVAVVAAGHAGIARALGERHAVVLRERLRLLAQPLGGLALHGGERRVGVGGPLRGERLGRLLVARELRKPRHLGLAREPHELAQRLRRLHRELAQARELALRVARAEHDAGLGVDRAHPDLGVAAGVGELGREDEARLQLLREERRVGRAEHGLRRALLGDERIDGRAREDLEAARRELRRPPLAQAGVDAAESGARARREHRRGAVRRERRGGARLRLRAGGRGADRQGKSHCRAEHGPEMRLHDAACIGRPAARVYAVLPATWRGFRVRGG